MKLDSRWLVCGLCSTLALALVPAIASAQSAGSKCSDMQMLQGKCDQQSKKSNQKSGEQEQKNQYPNATRKQPKVTGVGPGEAKPLNEGLAAANSGDSATALKDLQPIADSGKSAYAKSLAMLGLAQVKYRGGDTKGAIALQKQALDSNALDNNSYFQGLETLAQMYIADEDYSDALTTLDTWTKESGAQSADVYALQGNAYYRLQKYPQAVAAIQKAKSISTKPQASWDQIEMASYFAMDKYDDAAKLAEAALAKDPNNSTLLQNVIAIYINAHQDQKALALLERARANGQIKDQAGYMNMAKMYDNLGQNSSNPKTNAMKAVGVLQEGMSKGIVQPGYDSYKLLGDSYAVAGDYKNAVVAYGKAAPDAKTGEVDFLRGQMLEQLDQHKAARDALKQAVAKGGFKRVGAAYLTLGNAELALKDKAAARAAYEQAAQDPETRADAQRTLKQLGHKK
ncbi:MAG TPA: tetratricopeptide repeat protein [Rhodanobacteraceae bacterium]|nr:tetratricopeptide repeat protein [Rhodanobacteraceae bacterium]